LASRRQFGAIRRLGPGRWQASYVVDGKRHNGPIRFQTKADANAYLSEVETGLRRGGWVDPTAGKESLKSYADSWLSQRHDLRPRTAEDYQSLLALRIYPALGHLGISRITPVIVREWYVQLSKDYPGRAHKAYRLLRTILNTAVADEKILRNPCQVKGAGQDRSAERAIPTISEVNLLAAAMPPRFELLIQLAAWCGLRRGELLALTRSNIDLRNGSIRVDRSAQQLNGGEVAFGPPKTAAGIRTVHYPPELSDLMRRHLDAYVGRSGESLVFTGEKGGVLRPHVLQKAWVKARNSVGVNFRIHDLRHLGATLAANAGASTKELMQRIGHASPQASLIYQHASEDRDREIAQSLGGLMLAEGGSFPRHS